MGTMGCRNRFLGSTSDTHDRKLHASSLSSLSTGAVVVVVVVGDRTPSLSSARPSTYTIDRAYLSSSPLPSPAAGSAQCSVQPACTVALPTSSGM